VAARLAGAGSVAVAAGVIRACAFKAISVVGLSQVGGGNNFAAMGQVFASRADAEALSLTAELDLSTPMAGWRGWRFG
jgi:uncharacterized membrane protein